MIRRRDSATPQQPGDTVAASEAPPGVRHTAATRPQPSRLAGLFTRFWIVIVVVAVVGVAGFCVVRLRSIFGAPDGNQIASSSLDEIKPFNPKRVIYEVFGAPGTVANINYLDINAQLQRIDNVPLPWTLAVTTTLASVSVNVVAQGNTDSIGCRITVNDVVKDERSINEMNAQTFCIVKSA